MFYNCVYAFAQLANVPTYQKHPIWNASFYKQRYGLLCHHISLEQMDCRAKPRKHKLILECVTVSTSNKMLKGGGRILDHLKNKGLNP